MKLKNVVVLIIGLFFGIGVVIVCLFVEQGCYVVINYSCNEEGVCVVVKDCEVFGVCILVQQVDVFDDIQCQILVEVILVEFGCLDVLVNNVGIIKFCVYQDLDGLSKDDFLYFYVVNIVGFYQMICVVEKVLCQVGIVQVINMVFIVGFVGVGSLIVYVVFKGVLLIMIKFLVRVLGLEICVNVICSGFVQGEWLEKGLGKEVYVNLLVKIKVGVVLKDVVLLEIVVQVVLGLVIGGDLVIGEVLLVDGGSYFNVSGVCC